MDVEWDAENFETPNLKQPNPLSLATGDKWEGEDEEDDVKDNWEDEEEEKKDEEKPEEVKAVQIKKKKKIAEKIEEKERKDREEAARKLAAKEAMKKLTPDEKIAEKLRQQRLQEEADLQVTKETFGIIESTESIDAMNPNTQEEFNHLSEALLKKLTPLSSSVHFPLFMENLLRDISVNLNSTNIRKLKATLDTVYSEKTKAEKAEKTKKAKGKGKATLKVEGDNDFSAYGVGGDYGDFEDFI